MFKKILIVVALIVIVLVVVISLQPAQFRISRSIVIAASPAAVFAEVNDFHAWKAWSPWAKIDPAMTEKHEGSSSGKGAIYSWVGNNKVGEGRMTVTESRPSEFVQIKLEFLKPFEATNTAEFTFKPVDGKTDVTWAMYGTNNFMSKAVCLFMSMEKMVGPDFEKGLAQLKAVSEGQTK